MLELFTSKSSSKGFLDTIRFYFSGPWFVLTLLLGNLGSEGFLTNFFTEVEGLTPWNFMSTGEYWGVLGKTISSVSQCLLPFHRKSFALLGSYQILMNPNMEDFNYQCLSHKKWLDLGKHIKSTLVLVIRNVEGI